MPAEGIDLPVLVTLLCGTYKPTIKGGALVTFIYFKSTFHIMPIILIFLMSL
jgi:hypothetical protein